MALVRAGAYGGVIDRREQVLAHKRKGKGGRTHLVSPKMAAAIKGRLVDITKMAIVRADAYGGVIDRREQVLAHKRKGKGGRTHLASPQMAAATAIEGRFVDIRKWHASI